MMAPRENATMAWQAGFSAALLDAEVTPPAGLRGWNGSDPAKRFAVYRNNVVANLVDGLCETFPVCHELVGDDFFRAMAVVFIRNNPPQSRILTEYGSHLPDFLRDFEPAADLPYLADVARLEAARVTAWHAADAEPLVPESWSAMDPGQLSLVCVEAHPSVQLVRSCYPVFSIWAAHQDQGDLSAIRMDDAEDVLIIRPQLDVGVLDLPPGGADFLLALSQGRPLGTAADTAQEQTPQFDLATNLRILMQSGFAISYQI
jgi:hypothetical protein